MAQKQPQKLLSPTITKNRNIPLGKFASKYGTSCCRTTHPTKYTAMEMNTAIFTLVNQEQERVNNLATKEETLSEMWKQIPFFVVKTDESKSEKMQLLHGTDPISKKIKDMITTSTEDFKVYGTVS